MLTDEDVKKLQKVIVMPLDERMASVEGKVDNLVDRVESVEGKVDNLVDRVESVEGKVDNLNLGVSTLKVNVNAIYVIVKEDYGEFDKRIERLEKQSGINP